MGLLDRVNECLAYAVETGRVQHARDWSRKAGLSGGYVAALRTQLASGKQDTMDAKAARALAKVAGVRFEYLLDGEGRGPDREETAAPSCDGLFAEITRCRNDALREALGVFYCTNRSDAARHAVTHFLYSEHRGAEKLSVDEWMRHIRAYAQRVKRGMESLGPGSRDFTEDD